MKKLFCIFLIFVAFTSPGQTVTPQVINSAGGNWQLSNGTIISDNIGEPFITTISNSNNSITQGFLQNFVINNTFSVSIQKNDVSCKDKSDGNISTAITTNLASFSAQYSWTPQFLCPANNCSSVDSLKAGTYTVITNITYTIGQNHFDTNFVNIVIINDANGPCKVKIYSGITADGDGINDSFTIDNISEFPNNHLLIYNRWGLLLYDEHGYDNITKVWPRKDETSKLTPSTYFYMLYLEEGSSPIKGWVELMKN